jgi:hypothetical protein
MIKFCIEFQNYFDSKASTLYFSKRFKLAWLENAFDLNLNFEFKFKVAEKKIGKPFYFLSSVQSLSAEILFQNHTSAFRFLCQHRSTFITKALKALHSPSAGRLLPRLCLTICHHKREPIPR